MAVHEARQFSGEGWILLSKFDDGGRFPLHALVQVGDKWFLGSFVNEGSSMVDALAVGRGVVTFYEISGELSNFGITIADCARQNPAATIQFMRKRCVNALEYTRKQGYTFDQDINSLKSLLEGLAEDSPEELRGLMVDTLKQLEEIGVKS